MKLPKIVAVLIDAQNNYDSAAYANCFSETAVVTDEGKNYKGRTAIQNWIAGANEKYKTVMRPIKFVTEETASVLTAEISGDFEGSPLVLSYHFEIINEQIQSLKITD